jgi:glucosamine--fructose-6-phosphate aminotransferase (isomerizing)
MSLKDEIFQQPDIIQRLITEHEAPIRTVAGAIRQKRSEIDYAFLAARGTSDHAGLYAKYLWGAHNRWPVAMATPSLFSLYEMPPRLSRALVVGVSQSGQSPDIVSVVAEGRRQGACTLAITNAPDSPLAEAADLLIDIEAGVERAVAATKTYTAQLTAIALFSACLRDDEEGLETLQHLPTWIRQVLELDERIAEVAQRYRYMEESVVLGRGFNYATAFEWALKMKELTYTVSDPYSSADFRHGPVAMVAQGFPVFAVAPSGAVFEDILALLQKLKEGHQVELFVISDQQAALDLADTALALPPDVPEWLSPIVSIVPAQLFCYYLTRAKGFDTEKPRSLTKVTKTQ